MYIDGRPAETLLAMARARGSRTAIIAARGGLWDRLRPRALLLFDLGRSVSFAQVVRIGPPQSSAERLSKFKVHF